MLLKQEQLNPCEVELEVEIAADKVKSAIDRTYDELGKDLEFPGFRRGKAPLAVVKSRLDAGKVRDSAARSLMSDAYGEVLGETKLEPFAPPDVELVKFEEGEPMVFKAKVPLPPKVELGEYVGLEVERRVHTVTDEEVDEQIEEIRKAHGTMVPVTDRPVREGDHLQVRVSQDPDDEESRPVPIVVGENLPDFDSGIIGMNAGERKTIEVTYPENYGSEDLAGQKRSLTVTVLEIEELQLPELTDEWVKSTYAGDGSENTPESEIVDTVEKLRARIRALMERSAAQQADAEVRDKLVEQAINNADVCFPGVMVDEAVNDRLVSLSESLSRRKLTLDDYLKHIEKSLDELRQTYEEETREHLRFLLVMREIADKENIEVTEEDFDAEVKRIAEERSTTPEAVRAYIESSDAGESIRSRIRRKKVVDFIVHASNIKNVGP